MAASILVVGSVAFDSVKTPFGEAEEILGGSATYFSVAASYFAPVRVVAVVGTDFGDKHVEIFRKHKIDIEGLTRTAGKTFRWKGEYGYDLNEARTLDTQLNVFETFKPVIPEQYRSSEYVFLGNIDPELQLSVLEQIKRPRVVACDSMNFWIKGRLDAVKRTIEHVDILIIMPTRNRRVAATRIRMAIDTPFAMDLLVQTPGFVERRLARGDSFLVDILSRGVVLYERNVASGGRKPPSLRPCRGTNHARRP